MPRARRFLLVLLAPALLAGCLCHSARSHKPESTMGYWESPGRNYPVMPVTDALTTMGGHTPFLIFVIVSIPFDLITWPLRHFIPCPGGDGAACTFESGRIPASPRP